MPSGAYFGLDDAEVAPWRSGACALPKGVAPGHGISGLPVIDQGRKVVSMVSVTDLMWLSDGLDGDEADFGDRARAAQPLAEKTVGDVMAPDVFGVAPDATIAEPAAFFARTGLGRAPVKGDGKLEVGDAGRSRQVHAMEIDCRGVSLRGDLVIPRGAIGLVVFAHGSGSSRVSPRNRYVAGVLQAGGLATLLFDLLTPEEERIDMRTRHLRFDIPLLADRLVGATDWLLRQETTEDLPIGYFGASTGAAAALIAAATRPERVAAVVSRGGRPDLAGPVLVNVRAPTLLIVGGLDHSVIEMNEEALAQIRAEKKMEVVAGATHLFEEPGTLEQVAELARDWIRHHLASYPRRGSATAAQPVRQALMHEDTPIESARRTMAVRASVDAR